MSIDSGSSEFAKGILTQIAALVAAGRRCAGISQPQPLIGEQDT